MQVQGPGLMSDSSDTTKGEYWRSCLVYPAEEGLSRRALMVLQGLRSHTAEEWLQPLRRWLLYVGERHEVPYVPWLLYVPSLSISGFRLTTVSAEWRELAARPCI